MFASYWYISRTILALKLLKILFCSLTIYNNMNQTYCSKCNLHIVDHCFLMVADRCWHIDCLQCSVCSDKLESELTCFVKNGSIFCKKDYYKTFLKHCARCRRVLSPKELVMKAKDVIFHMKCFNCVICNCPLKPGEYFGLTSNNILYCKLHYEMMTGNGSTTAISSPNSVCSSNKMINQTNGQDLVPKRLNSKTTSNKEFTNTCEL